MTIEGRTITAVRAYWDESRGVINDGWYLKVRFKDTDENSDTPTWVLPHRIHGLPRDTPDSKIVEAVSVWLCGQVSSTAAMEYDKKISAIGALIKVLR